MYTTSKEMYRRVGHIEIIEARKMEDAIEGVVYQKKLFVSDSSANGLDFKFDYEINASESQGRIGQGSVGILGLQGDTIRRLVEFANQHIAAEKSRYVVVYAGYSNDPNADTKPLFYLPILGASLTQPPEMWLNITSYTGACDQLHTLMTSVREYDEDSRKSQKQKQEEAEKKRQDELRALKRAERDRIDDIGGLKKYIERICKSNGITLNWNLKQTEYDKIPKQDWPVFEFVNMSELVKSLNSLGWIKCEHNEYIGCGFGSIVTGYQAQSSSVIKKLQVNFNAEFASQVDKEHEEELYHQLLMDWVKKKMAAERRVIDKDSGMIGIPQFKSFMGQMSIEVKTLLRRDIDIGDFIKVESTMINIPDGYYYRVNKIRYEGEFRGQAWYTKFFGILEPKPEPPSEKSNVD